MPKPWDRKMKRLLTEAPQDFVEWLLSGAQYIGIVSSELDGEPLYTDMLYDVLLEGKPSLLHIEFQRRRDAKMAERLWEYNVRATIQYKCPVWSCVIYLKKDSTIAKPSLTKEMPNGRAVHRFDFDVIRLWEIPTSELKQKRLEGLLPLLPLTRGGAKREVVEEAIAGLAPAGQEPKAELLILTYGLASLAFENEADQEWLDRRFGMLYDILRETRAFRELTKDSLKEGIEEGRKEGRKEGIEEGRKEGIEEGRKEGIEEGKVEALREALLTMVQARFPNPKIARLAKGQAAMIDDPAVLQDLIVKVGLARTLEEAQHYLLDWPGSDNENN